MYNRFRDLYGSRINNLIIEYCTNVLHIKSNIESFECHIESLSKEQKVVLMHSMKLYQLQTFSINNKIWREFSDDMLGNKKKRKFQFQGMTNEQPENIFTYDSKVYKMTEFRIILQEYLLLKKMKTNV
jgi:hypothetical protein